MLHCSFETQFLREGHKTPGCSSLRFTIFGDYLRLGSGWKCSWFLKLICALKEMRRQRPRDVTIIPTTAPETFHCLGLGDVCNALITLCQLHQGNNYSCRWHLPLTRWKWKARTRFCSCTSTSPLLSWVGVEGFMPTWLVFMKIWLQQQRQKQIKAVLRPRGREGECGVLFKLRIWKGYH